MVFEQYQVWLFCIPPVSLKIWSYALIKYTWWSNSGWNGTFKWQYQSLFQKLLLTLTLVVTDSTETWDDKWWDKKIIMMTTCQLWWRTMTLGTLVSAILLCRAWAVSRRELFHILLFGDKVWCQKWYLWWRYLMPPQELAPFQRRIFLRGEAGSMGSGGSTPVGGRNINCSERKGDEEDYMLMLSLSNGQFIFSEWSAHVTHRVFCPREPPLERGAATGWFERLWVRQGLPPCTRDGPDIGVGLTWGKITRVSVWHQHCHHSVHHTIDHHTNRSCQIINTFVSASVLSLLGEQLEGDWLPHGQHHPDGGGWHGGGWQGWYWRGWLWRW